MYLRLLHQLKEMQRSTGEIPDFVTDGGLAAIQSSTLLVPFPATVNAGDFLICNACSYNSTNVLSDGWVSLGSTVFGGNKGAYNLMYKIAVGNEGGTNLTVESIGSTFTAGIIYRFQNVGAPIPSENLKFGGASPATSITNLANANSTGINRLACCFMLLIGDNLSTVSIGNWISYLKKVNNTGVGVTSNLFVKPLPITGTNAGQIVFNLTAQGYGQTFSIQLKPT